MPHDFKVEHRQESKIGKVDYLSKYTFSNAPPSSHCDSTFTVAKMNMINKVLNPPTKNIKSTKNGKEKNFVNRTRHNLTAVGEKTCNYVSANNSTIFREYANTSIIENKPARGLSHAKEIQPWQDSYLHIALCMHERKTEKQNSFSRFKSKLLNFFPIHQFFQ